MKQEKRARRILTRPKPTIIGNCEGWSFIVGKKPARYSPKSSHHQSLQCRNKNFIHNLSTCSREILWTTCARTVDRLCVNQIVPAWWTSDFSICPKSTKIGCYSNQICSRSNFKLVSANIYSQKRPAKNIFLPCLLSATSARKPSSAV